MARYQKGNFSTFSKSERVMVMQMYAKKLQAKLGDGGVDSFFAVNDEIEELSKKAERAKTTDIFDTKDFTRFLKRYREDEVYREDVNARIAAPMPIKNKKKK